MADILKGTVHSPDGFLYGTKRRIIDEGKPFPDVELAAKSGTTQNWSDGWILGFSPDITAGAWMGFKQYGLSLGFNQDGSIILGNIWVDYMRQAHLGKNKVYFNSENNVYSTVPVAIFSGSSARFIGQTSSWGRDTGVDSVIANRPLLVLDGNIMFGSGGEEKEASRGNRSFLGATGSTGYIGVVHSASVAESAKVLQAMGIKNAINLDDGGSTALWSGGYKVGPGRNLPNVVLFVKK